MAKEGGEPFERNKLVAIPILILTLIIIFGYYQATKAAVIQMSRVAAVDYCTRGIRVMAVLPGIIKTRMSDLSIGSLPGGETIVGSLTPMARMGEPEEVAAPVVFLCSDEASYMTGSYIAVDGGALIPMPPTPKTSKT